MFQVFSSLNELAINQPGAVALGTFDGLHLGHQQVFDATLMLARAQNLLPTVFTFSTHPKALLNPEAVPPTLMPLAERLERFEAMGFQAVAAVPFDVTLRHYSAERFLTELLLNKLNAKALVMGENFRFGSQRQGCPQWLAKRPESEGLQVITCPLLSLETPEGLLPASSSTIREALQSGNLGLATQVLGRPWSLRSTVIAGQQLGRQLGFPTANLLWPDSLVQLPYGVYAVEAQLGSEKLRRPAVANWGKRPTVAENAPPLLEVHLLEGLPSAESLTDKTLTVRFIQQLRGEQRFASLDELKAQIAKDCQQAKTLLASV